jgi:hypothetical protein
MDKPFYCVSSFCVTLHAMKMFKIFSCNQVLPRENGLRYPWNFIFHRCFWKKKSIVEHHASSLKVTFSDKISKEKASFSGKDTFEPAVEVISLDMKQQELDGRYMHYNLNALVFVHLK